MKKLAHMLKNKTQKELLQLCRTIIQPLAPNFHKGQSGKIAVIGGSEDYTGAPFFASHSSALLGADLSHIICEKMASPVLKLYSPDLMVHPYLYELQSPEMKEHLSKNEVDALLRLTVEDVVVKDQRQLDEIIEDVILPKIVGLLERIDIVVIGPGFGRDPLMLKTLVKIIEQLKVMNKPMILDADALYLLSIDPLLVKNYSKAIITPNVVEFDRLAKKLNVKFSINETDVSNLIESSINLSQKLGNVTVIQKNFKEIMVRDGEYLINELEGSNRRVGGQGDTLTGAIATFVNWSNNYNDGLWDPTSKKDKLSSEDLNLLACFAASSTVRLAASKAFAKYGRSMQTSNVHEFLGKAYDELFENDNYIKL